MKKGKKPRLIGEQELLLVARVKEAVFQLKVFFFSISINYVNS